MSKKGQFTLTMPETEEEAWAMQMLSHAWLKQHAPESLQEDVKGAEASAPNWEAEAKRAFWTGLEIGACMGSVKIAPRWEEYIEKRKGELNTTPAPPASAESIEKNRLDAEDLEATHSALDDQGAPRHENEVELSLWGRVVRYAASAGGLDQAALVDAIECEIINSVSLPFKIHMSGVFAVIRNKLERGDFGVKQGGDK